MIKSYPTSARRGLSPVPRHLTCLLILWCMLAPTALAQAPVADDSEPPLPTRVVINVDSAERALYRIAIPNLLGVGQLGAQAADVLRNDLQLVGLFEMVDGRSFIANLEQEGLGIKKSAWTSVGAQGVIKGHLRQSGNAISVDLRLYELARGEQPILSKRYDGNIDTVRAFMHDFANQVLKVLTGREGAFGTRLVYAKKLGPGRKDIYVADFDGSQPVRVSGGSGTSMLPNFGPNGIWYSQLSKRGAYITHSQTSGPIIRSSGLNMGVTYCEGRLYYTSTRDGNSEIYSALPNGSDERRLTNDQAIDVSPTCGPAGHIIFISSRHGGAQVFMMPTRGGSARRLTFKGAHNQTPAFCQNGKTQLLAFSGRDGGGFDIFTLNLGTGVYTRLTQGQGINQDPTFSPDCRMVAFASSRGGIFITGLDGMQQHRVITGPVSTVRWGK